MNKEVMKQALEALVHISHSYEIEQVEAAIEALQAALDAPQEPVALTDEQIDRHTLLASECSGSSKVMLVSSIDRLLYAAPKAAPPALPEGITPLTEFADGQWWLKELDGLTRQADPLTQDQHRAIAVVRNLMRTVEYLNAAPKAAPHDETDWRAIARVQSAKLSVALDEPGASERLDAVMRGSDWKDTPAAPARQPLTLEQINRIEMSTEWPEGSLRNIGPHAWGQLLVAATRAVEHAHKIGSKA